MSMMASEYLSQRADKNPNAFKASTYTGLAYIFTVIVLVSSYFIFSSPYVALVVMLMLGISIIAIFNYFLAITKDENFKNRFLEMTIISLSVAIISFLIGYLLNAIVPT